MAGITLAQAEAKLAEWMAADTATASSQSYEIDTGNGRRKLTRADAVEIRENIKFWNEMVNSLTSAAAGGRRRVRYVVPE